MILQAWLRVVACSLGVDAVGVAGRIYLGAAVVSAYVLG